MTWAGCDASPIGRIVHPVCDRATYTVNSLVISPGSPQVATTSEGSIPQAIYPDPWMAALVRTSLKLRSVNFGVPVLPPEEKKMRASPGGTLGSHRLE